MDDKTLRKRLIRLAYERPELRDEILPLVAKTAAKDSLHGLVEGFMLAVADELKKAWKGGVAGLIPRRTSNLISKPWVLGVAVSPEAQQERMYDRNVAVHLDRGEPLVVLYDTSDVRKPRQVSTGSFSVESASPKQAAQAIISMWESASYSMF